MLEHPDSSLSEQDNEIQNSVDHSSSEATGWNVVFNGGDDIVTIDDVVVSIHALEASGIFDSRYGLRTIIKDGDPNREIESLRLASIDIFVPEIVIARQELLANLASRHRQAWQQRQDWLNSFSFEAGTSQSYIPPPDEIEEVSWSAFINAGQSQAADVPDEDSDDEPRLSIVLPEDMLTPDSPEAEEVVDEEELAQVTAPAPRAVSPPLPRAIPPPILRATSPPLPHAASPHRHDDINATSVPAPRESPIFFEARHRNLPPEQPRYQRPRSTVIRHVGKYNY